MTGRNKDLFLMNKNQKHGIIYSFELFLFIEIKSRKILLCESHLFNINSILKLRKNYFTEAIMGFYIFEFKMFCFVVLYNFGKFKRH